MVKVSIRRFPRNGLRKRPQVPVGLQGGQRNPEHPGLPPEGPVLSSRPDLRPVCADEAEPALRRRQLHRDHPRQPRLQAGTASSLVRAHSGKRNVRGGSDDNGGGKLFVRGRRRNADLLPGDGRY